MADETIDTKETTAPDGFDVTGTKEFQGLLSDKTRETRRRQQLEDDNSALQTQLNEATSRLNAPREDDIDSERDPEDLVTVGDIEEILNKRDKTSAFAKEQNARDEQNQQFMASETQARAELTTKTQGEGLDFETVLAEGFREMQRKNPAYMQVVMASDNPAREAYEIGLRHPDIAARLDTRRNTQMLDKINKNPTRLPGGSGGSGGGSRTSDDVSKLMSLPESQLLQMVQDG